MARLCVYMNEQGDALLLAAAHDVLQSGNEFQGVEWDHMVIVVSSKK